MRVLRAMLVVMGCLVAAAFPATTAKAAEGPLTVFAAASLTNAFEDIGRAWVASGRAPVRFSFAASSALARQIENGAPAAIFASADEAWMDYLAHRQHIDPASRRTFAANRLVLVVPADRALTIRLARGVDLVAELAGGRIATGDPAHVPVGRYAQAALTAIGQWDRVARRLVRADSVRAALAYVERGEVAAGIVYATDAAISPKVRIAGTFDATTHTPITYPVALVRGHVNVSARAFLDFLATDAARAILRHYGFDEP